MFQPPEVEKLMKQEIIMAISKSIFCSCTFLLLRSQIYNLQFLDQDLLLFTGRHNLHQKLKSTRCWINHFLQSCTICSFNQRVKCNTKSNPNEHVNVPKIELRLWISNFIELL